MSFFTHNLGEPDRGRVGADIWVRDEPYTRREEWLEQPFNRWDYERDETKYLYFRWIDDQFVCGDPKCECDEVECVWYRYEGIDLGVDKTFGEFRCTNCGKYTFVEYRRDSS